MKLIEVVDKLMEFHRTQHKPAATVTLNPQNMREILNDGSFTTWPDVSGDLKPGALARRARVDWYEDIAVPEGEIRLA